MSLKDRAVLKFPARVDGGTAIEIEKSQGVYTFSLDLGALNQGETVADQTATFLPIVTPSVEEGGADLHELISIEHFLTETSAVNENRQIISGAGLAGGGDLSTDRTLAVGAGTGIAVSADDVALDTTHVRNVDHSTVSVIAGAGLTGGGTIAADRTLDVGAGTGIAVNANDVALAAIADQRVMANVSGGSTAPSANTLTAILDAILGTTQGAIVTRQGAAWVKLDPGTSGHFLKSQGAGANLTYAAVPGGGDLLSTNNLSDVESAATSRQNLGAISRTLGVPVTLTNQTSVDFTSIPTGCRRLTVAFSLSPNGSATPIIQLGTAGGIETSSYIGSVVGGIVGTGLTGGLHSTGFSLGAAIGSSSYHGALIFTMIDASANVWVCHGTHGQGDLNVAWIVGGYKALSGTLTQVRLTTSGGTAQFDSGQVNILYDSP